MAKTRYDTLAHWIVAAAIFMNFILAIFNNWAFRLSETSVTIAQLSILTACLCLLLSRLQSLPPFLLYVMGATIFFSCIAGFRLSGINFKFLHDALLIPVFALLGNSITRLDWRFIGRIAIFIFAVALLEAVAPALFVRLVNPLSYYSATRPWALATFLQQGHSLSSIEGLYLGAVRPKGSALGFLTEHRVASVFLEPVSLAYFFVLLSIFVSSSNTLNIRFKLLAAFVAAVVCLMADTRTGLGMLVTTTTATFALQRLSPRFALLWPVCISLGLVALYPMISAGAFGQELPYRLSITANGLEGATVTDLLFGGLDRGETGLGDSGALYILSSAGVGGCIAFLLATSLGPSGNGRAPLSHSLTMFFSFVALFGGAFLSIKTAAFAGFMIGAMMTVSSPAKSGRSRTSKLGDR